MNAGGTEMFYGSHMSTGPAPPPQTVTSNGMPPQYGHQPTLLQPGPAQYPSPYPYTYTNGMTSPHSGPPSVTNAMGATGTVLPLPSMPAGPGGPNQYANNMDTTGQVAPTGMKPRVTATLWEDEGSLCFQVEARGICVARREDNHMINGTKLLNVAGMTRGRRDGILKSEKVRHVVKIGPMHLKGVWIPFERALEFANKEKITELLYPLFVHNIGALLYHPTNQSRTNQVMAAAERVRKQDPGQVRGGPGGPVQPGALPSIHHHQMTLPGPGQHAPPQPSLPSHGSSGRPSIDRAHTFPTPPTSASSVMGGMGGSENMSWGQQGMNGPPTTNSMSIDTSLSNARSMPATPATTPPGAQLQSMPSYPQSTQPYDNSRGTYSQTTPQQSQYPPSTNSPQDRGPYGAAYMRGDMPPPAGRPSAAGEQDVKPPNGMIHPNQQGENGSQHVTDDEPEHEAEYTHDSGYDSRGAPYNYNTSVQPISGEHTNLSPEITGSPSHQNGSGRATPRTTAPAQPFYSQQPGYNTPPRVPSSSNLYNVMSNDRGTTNGSMNGDVYASHADMGSSMQSGYAPASVLNGNMKRGRDDDEDLVRPSNGLELKRRKTIVEGVPPGPAYDTLQRPVSATSQGRR